MHRRPLFLRRPGPVLGPDRFGGRLLGLGPGPGPLDHRPERAVPDRALEQSHPGRPHHIGPSGGRRPEDVVGPFAGRVRGMVSALLPAVLVALVGRLPLSGPLALAVPVVLMPVVGLLDVVRVHAHLP
ncbi:MULTISPECIES: hypothetical protein [Streptomyces]|uniref:hypothetical protein n=1 Tax=Streptomyces TaxID=1883 RepID=UPI0004BE4ADA